MAPRSCDIKPSKNIGITFHFMMDNVKFLENVEDLDVFNVIKNAVEKELSNMKKIVNTISQMRVEAAYLESDLLLTIDSSTWLQISDLIGLGTMNLDVGLEDMTSNY